MKGKLSALSVIIMQIFLVSFAVPVFANSAQTQWSGSDSASAFVTDKDSPIIVEKEILTFDIPLFPENYYQNANDFLAYNAKVTAQYTFFNPSNDTVTVSLAFPFGNLPDYAGYYEAQGTYANPDDGYKYDVTVNNKAIDKALRHTLFYPNTDFKLERDLSRLQDGYMDDEFYRPDLPVTKYTYEIRGLDEKYTAANAAFDSPVTNGKIKLLFAGMSGISMQNNKNYRLSDWAENGQTLTVYVFGEKASYTPQWKFYKDGGLKDKDEIDGNAVLISTEKMGFKAFALMKFPRKTGIMETDWYNAMVADLNESEKNYGYTGIVSCSGNDFDISHLLMRWYEYEITLFPNERVTNAVTAPIYPSINGSLEPAIYEYTYLLSPAKSWKEFGPLKINVNTPYFLTNSSLDFEKTQNGYSASLNGLPDCELSFTLSKSSSPEKAVRDIKDILPIEIIIFLSVAGVVLLVAVLTIVFTVLYKKKHNKD